MNEWAIPRWLQKILMLLFSDLYEIISDYNFRLCVTFCEGIIVEKEEDDVLLIYVTVFYSCHIIKWHG